MCRSRRSVLAVALQGVCWLVVVGCILGWTRKCPCSSLPCCCIAGLVQERVRTRTRCLRHAHSPGTSNALRLQLHEQLVSADSAEWLGELTPTMPMTQWWVAKPCVAQQSLDDM